MKTKTTFLFTILLGITLMISFSGICQQTKKPHVEPQKFQQTLGIRKMQSYTYKVFIAADKTFGFNVLEKGKLLYSYAPETKLNPETKISFTKKQQAETAAILTIEKIKHGLPAELSKAELIKLSTL